MLPKSTQGKSNYNNHIIHIPISIKLIKPIRTENPNGKGRKLKKNGYIISLTLSIHKTSISFFHGNYTRNVG